MDVESAYQRGDCTLLAAVPVMQEQTVLGVISMGLPDQVPFTAECAPAYKRSP